MTLLGEGDAHDGNIGLVCDQEKTCSFAKVDNKISLGRIAELGDQKCSRVRYFYEELGLQNNYALARAMETIASIPDNYWQEVVLARIQAYTKETGGIPKDKSRREEYHEKIINGAMKIKEKAVFYADSLYIEGAILQDDIEMIKKLEIRGLDINKKYFCSVINACLMTPLEMAVVAGSKKVLEYIYSRSNEQLKMPAIMQAVYSTNKHEGVFDFFANNLKIFDGIDYNKNKAVLVSIESNDVNKFNFFLTKDPDILHSLDYYNACVSSDSDEIFKIFLARGSMNVNGIPELINRITVYKSCNIYKQLINTYGFSIDEYLSHVSSIASNGNRYDPNDGSRCLMKLVLEKLRGNSKAAKDALERIISTSWVGYYSDIVVSTLIPEIKDDQFLIKTVVNMSHFDQDLGYILGVIDNFTTPKESCRALLYQLLDDKLKILQAEYSKDSCWRKCFVKLVDNIDFNKKEAEDLLLSLLENKKSILADYLVIKLEKNNPKLFTEVDGKFEGIAVKNICSELYNSLKREQECYKGGLKINGLEDSFKSFKFCDSGKYSFDGYGNEFYIFGTEGSLKKIHCDNSSWYSWIKKIISG